MRRRARRQINAICACLTVRRSIASRSQRKTSTLDQTSNPDRKAPLVKDLNDSEFDGTPANERLVPDLAQGDFPAEQRTACWPAEPAPEKRISP